MLRCLMASVATAEVLPSVSKVAGFGGACPGVLKVSCCGVALWALLKFGDRRVNDLELLYGYVVGVACLQREIPCRWICIHLACRTS